MTEKKLRKYYGVYTITHKCLGHCCAYNGYKLLDGNYAMLFLYERKNNVYVRVPWDNSLTQRDIKAFIKGYLYFNKDADFEYIESVLGDNVND